MSDSDNKLHFVGMVANTPIARPAKNGIFLTFTVQIVERWEGRDKAAHEELTDVDLAVFGDQARKFETSLKVGMWIDVEGKLQTQRGNRKSDGKAYAILKVKPTRIEILKGGEVPRDLPDRDTSASFETPDAQPASTMPDRSPGPPLTSAPFADNDAEIPF